MPPLRRDWVYALVADFPSLLFTINGAVQTLEEADELADRIAIMSKGKLLILGSTNYIKKTFGVGYHLYINSKVDPKTGTPLQSVETIRQQFIPIVKQIIPNSEPNPQQLKDVLDVVIPFSEQRHFGPLFVELLTALPPAAFRWIARQAVGAAAASPHESASKLMKRRTCEWGEEGNVSVSTM